jgi:hypothetical protein
MSVKSVWMRFLRIIINFKTRSQQVEKIEKEIKMALPQYNQSR